MCQFVLIVDPNTELCISTGDKDALSKPENAELQAFLRDNDHLEEGIKLPPGERSHV